MPVFNCRLNSEFKKQIKSSTTRVQWVDWDHVLKVSIGDVGLMVSTRPTTSSIGCCGINEISFGEDFVTKFADIPVQYQAEVLARAIAHLVCRYDHRIYIVGLVVGYVGDKVLSQSYRTIQKLLTSFGAKPLNSHPYYNENTNNKIVVMAMRKPARMK